MSGKMIQLLWLGEAANKNNNSSVKNLKKNLNNCSGHSKKKRRVKNKQFMAGVSGVVLFEDEPRTSQIQKKAKEFCKWKGKEFPGAQPVSMDLQNIGYLHDKPYRVSWKADGVRYSTLKYYLLALPAVPSA